MKGGRVQKISDMTKFKVCDLKYKITGVLNIRHMIYKNSVYIQLCILWLHFGKIRLIYSKYFLFSMEIHYYFLWTKHTLK